MYVMYVLMYVSACHKCVLVTYYNMVTAGCSHQEVAEPSDVVARLVTAGESPNKWRIWRFSHGKSRKTHPQKYINIWMIWMTYLWLLEKFHCLLRYIDTKCWFLDILWCSLGVLFFIWMNFGCPNDGSDSGIIRKWPIHRIYLKNMSTHRGSNF